MTGAEYVAFLGAVAILVLTPGPDTFLTLRFAAHRLRAGFVYSIAAALGTLVWAILALTGVAALLQRFPEVRVVLTWAGGAFLVYLGAKALLHVRAVLRASGAGRETVAAETADTTEPVTIASVPTEAVRTAAVPTEPVAATRAAAEDLPAEPGPVATGSGAAATEAAPTTAIGFDTPARVVFRTGIISSLTNPKTGLFFLALLPPFLPHAPSLTDHLLMLLTVAACMGVYGVLLSLVARRVGRMLTRGRGPLVVDTVAGVMLVLLGVSIVAL